MESLQENSGKKIRNLCRKNRAAQYKFFPVRLCFSGDSELFPERLPGLSVISFSSTQAQPQEALVPVKRYKRYLSSSLLVFRKEII